MTRVVSPRYQVSRPSETLRDEPADVPADIKRVVDGLEQSAMYGQGIQASRPAAAIAGRLYYATDTAQLYWDTGSTWIAVGPVGADSLTAAQIAPNAITASELADGSVDTAAIQNAAVTGAKIANNTILTANLAPNLIGAAELADNAVDTAAIQDAAVTNAKISAVGGITGNKLATDTITATQIAPNAIGTSELADGAVDTAAIQDASINPSKLSLLSGLQLNKTNSQPQYAGSWMDIQWTTLQRAQGNYFWNGSNAFDLLDTGWHQIFASIHFDTYGAAGIRLLNMSSGGVVVAQNGPYYPSGYTSQHVISLSSCTYSGPIEYVMQVFLDSNGNLFPYGGTPVLSARVSAY